MICAEKIKKCHLFQSIQDFTLVHLGLIEVEQDILLTNK